jgi:DNA-binding winged helix-turn-helix (wHTH) protein
MDHDHGRRETGALLIDARTRSVLYRGVPVELTATEYRILELLDSHPGWVWPAREIADSCLESGGSAESIVVHVSNLRGKLFRAAGGPTLIETVRGFGYRLSPDSIGVLSTAEVADSSEALGDELIAGGSLADAAAAYLQALDAANPVDEVLLARLHMKAAQVAADRRLFMEAIGHISDSEKLLLDVDAGANQELLDDVVVQRTWIDYDMGEFQKAYDECVELLRRIENGGTPRQRMRLQGCALMSLLSLHRFVVTAEVLGHAWRMYAAWEDSGDLTDAVYTESLLGATLLYAGNIAGGERRLTDGLRMSEVLGERTMRPHILISLGIVARRRGQVKFAEQVGRQLISEADEREQPEFAGAGHGLLCWGAWRAGDLDRSVEEGTIALRSVQLMPTFPFWWIVLAPLVAIAVHLDNLGDAIGYARHMLDPSQQVLPHTFNDALFAACAAWDAGNDSDALAALSQAVLAGRSEGYT